MSMQAGNRVILLCCSVSNFSCQHSWVFPLVLFGFSTEDFQILCLEGGDLVVSGLGTELGNKVRGFSIQCGNGQVILSAPPLRWSREPMAYPF